MYNEGKIPENFKMIETIESHTAGEPLRVIVNGLPDIEGKTILEDFDKLFPKQYMIQ